MLAFLNVLLYLGAGLWVGAMAGFGILFAPVLFRSLESRQQAGNIAGQVISRIHSLGLVTGGVLLVVTILQAMDRSWREPLDLVNVLVVVAMLALTIYSVVTLSQRLQQVQGQIGRPIEELAEDDPLRQEYNRYHRLSRQLFGLTMLLGVILIVVSALR